MDPETAWAAGLFEGEGTLTGWHGPARPNKQWYMKIEMCDLDVIQRFHRWAGCGAVYNGYDRRKETYSPTYLWKIGARKDIERIMDLLYPWLCSRRKAKIDEVRLSYAGRA